MLLDHFRECLEKAGILLVLDGEVGSLQRIKLNEYDFLGIVITGDIRQDAPIIFLNTSACVKSLVFTIAHELAHIWLNDQKKRLSKDEKKAIEKWCNSVASHILLPEQNLNNFLDNEKFGMTIERNELINLTKDIANQFSICRGIVIRRLREMGYFDNVTEEELCESLEKEYVRYAPPSEPFEQFVDKNGIFFNR